MAHAVDLTVVAEGVETPAQLEKLRELGCDQAQGYHLGHPCSAAELFDSVNGQ
jgi:EAL domain-containing protein (putative c-di-GMP-specific phosphodiesterase class I)